MENQAVTEKPKVKHSGLGLASFIISMVDVIIFVSVMIIGSMMASKSPMGLDETSPLLLTLGMLIIFSLILCLVGIGLGIAGIVKKNRKKLFAVLGLVFNVAFLLGIIILLVVGLSLGNTL